MDQDSSRLKYPQDRYISAQNFRPITDAGESTGALENVIGNTASFSFAGLTGSTDTIIGSTNIRSTTVLFSTDGTGANPGGVDTDVAASATSAGRIWTVDTTHPIPQDTLTLLVDAELNFTSQWPIEAVGRYENSDTQKVYWVDELNNLRFANLAASDISTQTPTQFDIIADVELSKPAFTSMGGGSLNVGVVQYAYQLFNNNGAETTFSPASDFIHLTSSPEGGVTSQTYKGTAQLDDTGVQNVSGKSVTMTISGVDTSFDQIKIVAIHYVSLNATPTINIVTIKPVAATVLFTDDGVYAEGSVTLGEYRLLSQRLFAARTIETKDNILFPGNITDRFFDVDYDARAYRFNTGQTATLFESDGSTFEYGMTGPSPLYPTGGATGAEIDAFNIYNDISQDDGRPDTAAFMYQPDGARIGGSGPNMGYTFSLNNEILDASSAAGVSGTFYVPLTDTDEILFSYSNYASPYVSGTQRGYHRGEIYRFGIILYDTKGRVSPVKWIGDIRMPDQSSLDSVTTFNDGVLNNSDFRAAFLNTVDNKTRMNILNIDWTINNLPSTVSAYQIVRVRREPQDRTVLAQGEIFPAVLDGAVYNPVEFTSFLPESPDNNDVLSNIYSPEISFNKNLVVGGNDFIEAVCGKDISTTGSNTAAHITYEYGAVADGRIEKYRNYLPLGPTEYSSRIFDITDGQIIPVGGIATAYSINSVTYVNQLDTANTSYGGSTLVINEPGLGWMASGGAATAAMVNYRRPVSQYGGASFEDRSLNEYIACSDVFAAGEGSANDMYGGDTFIGFFDCQRLMWDLEQAAPGDSFFNVHYAVVESSINLPLRTDDSFHRVSGVANAYLIQESAGVHIEDDGAGDSYTQETDLYLYNSVYSQENTSKIYVPIPSGFSAQTKSDALVLSSDVKSNGELIDSWTKFQQNEEIEVDTRYGPISKLLNFRNHLVYFQDNGVGTVGVNQQTLVQSGSLPELVLGDGNILTRYDYITIDSGCQIREAVCQSNLGFYWYDTVKNKFNRYSGQLKNISDVGGLFSYFNSKVPVSDDGISDLFVGTQIQGVFDDKFSEAIYNFKDIRKGVVTGIIASAVAIRLQNVDGISVADTVVIDGISTAIGGVQADEIAINEGNIAALYTTGDDIRVYITDSDNNFTLAYNEPEDAFYYSPAYTPESYIDTFADYLSVTGGNAVYQHNKGFRGNFYGVYTPSTVQILANPNGETINVYNNVELMTEITDSAGADVTDETINSVRVTNDYQDSGVISLVPDTNIRRRLRKWRFAIPRDDLARIRDAHAKMLFSWTNTSDNKRIVFHDVITHYIPSEK